VPNLIQEEGNHHSSLHNFTEGDPGAVAASSSALQQSLRLFQVANGYNRNQLLLCGDKE
jgi:hypothetical protein